MPIELRQSYVLTLDEFTAFPVRQDGSLDAHCQMWPFQVSVYSRELAAAQKNGGEFCLDDVRYRITQLTYRAPGELAPHLWAWEQFVKDGMRERVFVEETVRTLET